MTTTTTTTSSVLDRIRAGEPTVTRHRLLVGESDDPTRRGDKTVIAFSACTYYCPDWPTLARCAEAIEESDQRLRARPDELMLWDWDTTWLQLDNPTDPTTGGGTILLGVAWYDRAFFDDRAGAWFGAMHQRIYRQIGVPMEEITVHHFLAADHAIWKSDLELAA